MLSKFWLGGTRNSHLNQRLPGNQESDFLLQGTLNKELQMLIRSFKLFVYLEKFILQTKIFLLYFAFSRGPHIICVGKHQGDIKPSKLSFLSHKHLLRRWRNYKGFHCHHFEGWNSCHFSFMLELMTICKILTFRIAIQY